MGKGGFPDEDGSDVDGLGFAKGANIALGAIVKSDPTDYLVIR